MKTPMHRFGKWLALAAVFALAAGCNDGGGDDDGGSIPAVPLLMSIEALGLSQPVWTGTTLAPPACPGPVAQNATLVFEFGGPVDPATVPPAGSLSGSINITTLAGTPLAGTFSVEDDPSLPPGNRRRVVVRPDIPATAPEIGVVGFPLGETLQVSIPTSGVPQVLSVAGQPIATAVLTCFVTCSGGACYADPVAGPPFVVSTTPDTFDPPATAAGCLAASAVTIRFSEPLLPSGIDTTSVQLQKFAGGVPVAGAVVFHQAGTPEAGPTGARIDFLPSGPLVPATFYELVISPAVRDLTGNPAVLYEPGAPGTPASGRRLVTLAAVPTAPQPPIVEEFDVPSSVVAVAGLGTWTPGAFTLQPVSAVFGDGSFGAMSFASGPSTLDTAGQAGPGFSSGVWDVTSLTVAQGAVVRLVGHTNGNLFRPHIRCIGAASIAGQINGSAGASSTAPIGDPEQGARPGAFNNGAQASPVQPTWVAGGVGGAGGGRGGHASQADLTGVQTRTVRGEDGFGPPIAGNQNPGPAGANPFYGGGQGGEGGFTFPAGGVQGEVGGMGAAGGSSFSAGGDGGPFSGLPTCTPVATPVHPRALASGPPPVFVTPVSVQSAGSGGGGGGDKFEATGVVNDDQGGGGGGGGGSFRVTAVGSISILAGTVITMTGGSGGAGSVFNAGHGAGGSGGEIWLQSAADLIIASTSAMSVGGGTVTQPCGNFGAGRGGSGLYQFEDADGIVNTNFTGAPVSGGSIVALPFGAGSPGLGTGVTSFIDTMIGIPDFQAPSFVSALGNIPGATVEVRFQGAYPLPGGGADLSTLTPPVAAAAMDQLDGYRYVRVLLTLGVPLTPLPPPNAVYPSVQSVTLNVSAPQCP